MSAERDRCQAPCQADSKQGNRDSVYKSKVGTCPTTYSFKLRESRHPLSSASVSYHQSKADDQSGCVMDEQKGPEEQLFSEPTTRERVPSSAPKDADAGAMYDT